ncbi:unnamed protein product [Hymenolepis diminuta]|uniref:General transcription factor IIF subunit 1 n=1 Tax=Hymenolepis diminuta TaxID=6216 RepID=A0A0R3SH83_HYMDI|nr:unnamed protein product [Hymenolepis diminuta]
MSDQSNRPRPEQRPIIAPQLITVSSNANASSPTGNVARPMTPLIVRTTGNASAPNVHRNLVLIRPSNVASIGSNSPRFIVQQNPVQQTRQILPQAVISQPSIASSSPSIISATTSSPSTSAASSQQVAQPKMTARAALLQNASIPVPVSNKNVPRSFELRYRAIPGPKPRDTSSNVAEARLRASSQDDDSETLKGEVVRVCPRPNQKFSILRYNSDRMDLYAISSSSGNANERISSSSSGLPEVFIQRENNLRQYKASHNIQDGPNKGAGSEFGQDAKEEARMRRLGISRQGYRPEDQPWLLTVGKGRTAKRYRGVKEGSVSANVGHFIFCQNGDGSFNAYPVDEWYKLSSEITYRFLRDEEAEEEFKNRYNTLNMFNVMVKRRLNPDEEDEDGNPRGKDGEDETAGTSSKSRLPKKKRTKSTKLPPKSSNFLLTELDEWKVYANDEDDEEDLENTLENTNGDEEGDERKKTTTAGNGEPVLSVKKRKELENRKKRAATIVARKRRATKQRARRRRKGIVQHSSDEEDDPFEEAVDESDPDDHEGDEVDYMTDSSSDEEKLSEEEREQIYEEQGVDEEAGLKGLLTDISDSEEEGNKDHEKKEQEELIQSNDEESNGESDIEDLDNEGQHHKGHRSGGDSKNRSFNDEGSASDSSSDSSSSSVSDSDIAPDDPSHLARKAQKKTELLQRISDKVAAQAAEEHSNTKRSFQDDSSSPQAKRFKPAAATTLIGNSSQAASATVNTPADDAFVAAVKKYLMRKPISLPDLLKKMKSKRLLPQSSGSAQGRVGTDDVAETMLANALRQLRPMKQIINGQSYLSLKR